MAGTTPVYGFPYQELGDAPDGPDLGHDLATAVENKFVSVDAAINAINGLTPVQTSTTTDEINFTNTTFGPGLTTVGVAFVAPPSGIVFITMSVIVSQNINGQATFVSSEVKTGSTVGSGTLVGSAANSDRGITVGRAINSGAVALLQASRRVMYTGLTAGASYNVRMMQCVDGGSGSLFFRELIVEPSL